MKDLGLKSLGAAKVLFSCLAAFAVFCMMSLSSCSNAISDNDLGVNTSDDAFALANFAKVNQALVDSLLTDMDAKSDGPSVDSSKFAGLVDKINVNLKDVLKADDAVMEGTRAAVVSSEEILYSDIDSLLSNVEKNCSRDFYMFTKALADYEEISLTESEVIGNANLTFNEKVIMLYVLPILTYDERYLPVSTRAQATDACLSAYNARRSVCTRNFAISAVGVLTCNPYVGIVFTVIAWAQYEECNNDALALYRECKNKAK